MFCFLEAYGILAPGPGIEPIPPALEGKVLTTGPPRKSPIFAFLNVNHVINKIWWCENDEISILAYLNKVLLNTALLTAAYTVCGCFVAG